MAHGDMQDNDEFNWLQDVARSDERVLRHLQAEAMQAEKTLKGTEYLQNQLLRDMSDRVPDVEIAFEHRKDAFCYYKVRTPGDEHWQFMRLQAQPSAHIRTSDVLAGTLVLDPNPAASLSSYWDMGHWDISRDGRLLAFTVDTRGDEHYQLHVWDIERQQLVARDDASPYHADVQWGADAATLFCIRMPPSSGQSPPHTAVVQLELTHCPPGPDDGAVLGRVVEARELHVEEDASVTVGLGTTSDDTHLIITVKTPDGTDVMALPLTASPQSSSQPPPSPEHLSSFPPGKPPPPPLTCVASGTDDDFDVLWCDHCQQHGLWLMTVDDCQHPNGRVAAMHRGGLQTLVLPEEPGSEIESVHLSGHHLAVLLRSRCSFQLGVYTLRSGDAQESGVEAHLKWKKQFPDSVGKLALIPDTGPPNDVLYLRLSGLVTPDTTLTLDINSSEETTMLVEGVVGFQSGDYTCELLWVQRPGGVSVPMHVAYHKSRYHRDGGSPLLLMGYGAYGSKQDPTFNPAELALLDRGWALAVAHVRGGGEMGSEWHVGGKGLCKKHTFEDLVVCGEHLVEGGYCSYSKMAGWGRSAGGLAFGAVVNMRPDLFQSVILDVPFLDPLGAMMDPSLPLTLKERKEWGDPLGDEEVEKYIRSYSPYQNLSAAKYPHLLLTAGLHDHRVPYWQPAKYAARLRQLCTDPSRLLLLMVDLGSGHFSCSGASGRLAEKALKYAFLIWTVQEGCSTSS